MGVAYIFSKSGGNWTQTAELRAADSVGGDHFGSAVSLSSDGSTAFIGSPDYPINVNYGAGAVYVFTKDAGVWSQNAKLTATDADYENYFDSAVSLSSDGSTVLISAPNKTVNGANVAGAAYIFSKSGGSWNQAQELTATDYTSNMGFGSAVGLSTDGTTVLIGAVGTQAVYIFTKSGTNWSQSQKVNNPDNGFLNNFGRVASLSADGTTLLVGNNNPTVSGVSTPGEAFIFTKNNGSWTLNKKLTVSSGDISDYFGSAVSLSADGTTALIGGPLHAENGQSNVGAAYIFTPSTTICPPSAGNLPTIPANSPYTYYLPFLACDSSNYTTYLALQNSSSNSATITLQYLNSTGGSVATPSITCTTLAAQAECIAPNPFYDGNQGTGIIYSTQPLNIIVAESTPYGGSAYAVSQGGANNLIAPVIIKGGLADFTTNLTIFNGGSNTVTAIVQFYQQDGTLVSAATKSFTLTADTSLNYDQSSDSSLGSNFYGWAQITSPADSKLVAQVLEQSPSQHFVALANAQATSQTTLYAPAIFHNAYGSFNTGVNIINSNSQPVTVTVTYYNHDGTTLVAPAFLLAAHSLQGIYQGSSGTGTGLPTSGLPDNFAGAVVVTAYGGGVAMAVNEFGGVNANGNAKSGTYSPASNGSGNVGLPVMANNGYGYTTGATIFNTSNQTVSGTIQYYTPDGTVQGTVQNFSIRPYQSVGVFQGDSSKGLPANFYGSAIVSESSSSGSNNDLIVTTNAASTAFFYSYTEPNG